MYGYLGVLLEGREHFEDESLAEIRNHRSSCGTDSVGRFAYLFHLLYSLWVLHAFTQTLKNNYLFPAWLMTYNNRY